MIKSLSILVEVKVEIDISVKNISMIIEITEMQAPDTVPSLT